MSDDKTAAALIEEALHLDGDPKTLQRFYQRWAESYDRDVEQEQYVAPATTVAQLVRHLGKVHALADVSVIDAGCGTGRVGTLLHRRGFRQIDGFDLSDDMVEVARRTGAYQTLRGGVDLNQPIDGFAAADYDAAISCGVFTSGHVMPEAIAHVAALVRRGGAMVISTRTGYSDESGYEAVSASLEERGVIERVDVLRNRPYTVDGNAHYWLYRVR